MKFIDKYSNIIISLLVLVIIFIVFNLFFPKVVPDSKKQVHNIFRRKEIKEATAKFVGNCEFDDFEKRRNCYHDQMIQLRKANLKVNLNFKLVQGDTEHNLKAIDMEDIIKIERPQLSLMSCASNTFFFDWNSEYIFISLENPAGGVVCQTSNKETIYIVPQSFKQSQIDSFLGSIRPIK